jgi:hypothetical protein
MNLNLDGCLPIVAWSEHHFGAGISLNANTQ